MARFCRRPGQGGGGVGGWVGGEAGGRGSGEGRGEEACQHDGAGLYGSGLDHRARGGGGTGVGGSGGPCRGRSRSQMRWEVGDKEARGLTGGGGVEGCSCSSLLPCPTPCWAVLRTGLPPTCLPVSVPWSSCLVPDPPLAPFFHLLEPHPLCGFARHAPPPPPPAAAAGLCWLCCCVGWAGRSFSYHVMHACPVGLWGFFGLTPDRE